MDLELTDKVVLVTGGSKGIGAAIVREFIAEGAHVINVNRSTDEGQALQAEYAEQGKLSASIMQEYWQDVGTPDRLEEINQRLNA